MEGCSEALLTAENTYKYYPKNLVCLFLWLFLLWFPLFLFSFCAFYYSAGWAAGLPCLGLMSSACRRCQPVLLHLFFLCPLHAPQPCSASSSPGNTGNFCSISFLLSLITKQNWGGKGMWLDWADCTMISLISEQLIFCNLHISHQFKHKQNKTKKPQTLSILLDKELIKTRGLEGSSSGSYYTFPKLLDSLLFCWWLWLCRLSPHLMELFCSILSRCPWQPGSSLLVCFLCNLCGPGSGSWQCWKTSCPSVCPSSDKIWSPASLHGKAVGEFLSPN